MKTAQSLDRARAIRELQLQQPLVVDGGKTGTGSAFAAEFLTEAAWKRLKKYRPVLLLSAARARVLGLKPQQQVAAIDAAALGLKDIWQLAAGAQKKKNIAHIPSPKQGSALIALAKQAGVLPALIWLPGHREKGALAFSAAALAAAEPAEVLKGETVSLPIHGREDTTLTSFRTRIGTGVHLALVIGAVPKNKAPLVRVHSSCVTGDLLGSQRCDCGSQLSMALERLKEESGILLYLYQEGRDIGITSKLRAYALQEKGMDTFAANQQLGFEEDERDFCIAAAILKSLGVKKIRLMTNNPDKIKSFEASGISVAQRVPLVAQGTAHSHHYIAAKKNKGGHLF